MHRAAHLFTLSLVLVATGCARYQSSPLDPGAELNALDLRSPDVALISRAAPLTSTAPFEPADGLDERELIAVALRLNTELAVSRARVGESQSQLISAGLFPDPELGVSGRPGVNGTDSLNADVDLMIELLRIGEREARQDVARATTSKVHADVAAKEFEVATEVRRSLTSVLAAERELELLHQELTLRKQGAELVTRRREVGDANALDVAASELELAEIKREHREAELRVTQVKAGLNRLLGLPPHYSLKLSDSGKPLEVRLIDVPTADALHTAMLAGRLDLRQKEAEYAIAERELRLEVIRQYPSLKIGPAFSHEGPSDNYLGVAVAMDVPLLNRNRGEIAAKLAQRDRVRAEYIDLLHRLSSDAFTSSARVDSLRREVNLQREQVLPLLDRNSKLFRAALDARELNIVDFVTVQQRALQTRRAYLRTLVEYRTAVIELDGATGMTLTGLRAELPLPAPPATQSSTVQPKETP